MKLHFHTESWKLARPFIIARGSRTETRVIVATLSGPGELRGRGEATPLLRYGETVEESLATLREVASALEAGEELASLLASLPTGAARNALDCAYWDWRCEKAGERIDALLGWPTLAPVLSAFTISVEAPAAMEAAARQAANRPLLKVKTSGEAVVESVAAVRRGAPESRLIVDANEAWPPEQTPRLLKAMADLGVELVEQPLPAGEDHLLAQLPRPVPVFADESFHTSADVALCRERYDGVNLKLDKTGGLTEALAALEAAREAKLKVMVGCMLGTSLAMAPAMVLAQRADVVDLDAPLLLADDREGAIAYFGSQMLPFDAVLWG